MRKLPYLVVLLIMLPAAAAAKQGPHNDPRKISMGCASCHVGHGVRGAALLPTFSEDFCFLCHGAPTKSHAMKKAGKLDPAVKIANLEDVFKKFSRHPIQGRGKHSPGEGIVPKGARHVECVDCHNHHRVDEYKQQGFSDKKRSPLTVLQFEHDLCYRCHGTTAGAAKDISRLMAPNNRSFHPVESRSKGSGRGLMNPWAVDSIMACTDCHGNSDANGPKGPHGSDFSPLLISRYETSDGPEAPGRYALCYGCHSREVLYTGSLFPSHSKHVQQAGESCENCHSGHGSQNNRALVAFGSKVRPSSSGRLEFVSRAPGAGECYLSCHNVDHNPKTY